MKLVLLMHLEEDDLCVERLLREAGVELYSRLPIEGHGPGAEGWYGEPAPYRSRLVLSVVPEPRAVQVVEAVAECRGVKDSKHPIRAFQLDVEAVAACLCEADGPLSTSPNRNPDREGGALR